MLQKMRAGDIDFVITWRIFEPRSYLFNVVDVEDGDPNNHVLISQVGESAMREVVGQSALQPLLTGGRQKIQEEVQKLMQKTLDDYKSGIEVRLVNMYRVNPPSQVLDAFREEQLNVQEMQNVIFDGNAAASATITLAREPSPELVALLEARDDVLAVSVRSVGR